MCQLENFPETSSQLEYSLWSNSGLPWHFIWLADNPAEVSDEHLSLLALCYEPTKVIRVRNKDKPWFDDQCRRNAFGLKEETHLRSTRDRSRVNWEQFVRCQVSANETYSKAVQ